MVVEMSHFTLFTDLVINGGVLPSRYNEVPRFSLIEDLKVS